VRPAASRRELEEAFRLIYSSYLRRGYMEPDPSRIRLSLFNALPSTATFVGVLEDRVIATVSLVPDSELGLPMDEVYAPELGKLRAQGRRLSEVTMLADRRLEVQRTLPMLLALMKLVFDYASLVVKADDLCIAVNPRHEEFYRRFLLFDDLDGLRTYPSVRNNPAVGLRLEVSQARQRCEGNELLMRTFFQRRTPAEVFLQRYRMTQDDLRYFFVELTSLFRKAPARAIEVLKAHYPGCPWQEWLAAPSAEGAGAR